MGNKAQGRYSVDIGLFKSLPDFITLALKYHSKTGRLYLEVTHLDDRKTSNQRAFLNIIDHHLPLATLQPKKATESDDRHIDLVEHLQENASKKTPIEFTLLTGHAMITEQRSSLKAWYKTLSTTETLFRFPFSIDAFSLTHPETLSALLQVQPGPKLEGKIKTHEGSTFQLEYTLDVSSDEVLTKVMSECPCEINTSIALSGIVGQSDEFNTLQYELNKTPQAKVTSTETSRLIRV